MPIRAFQKGFIVIILIVIGAGTCFGSEIGMARQGLPEDREYPVFQYATDELWQYLRKGLNYLESPRPAQDPETVSPLYIHPDGRGFGCYGFSPEAYQDVQRLYPYFRRISWEHLLSSFRLYDLANQAFCDWLIKNLRDYCEGGKEPSDVFDTVQQAWNLGLSGFKNGRKVVSSRMRRAKDFKNYYEAQEGLI
ncbi:MAG: hypothetical protein KBC23_02055 [Candidatus Omnitrophica bacterium]|nr:hypothetical protein [Candidatus Omnitrophota bacterium]